MMLEPSAAIQIGGILHLLWAGFHLRFPRMFRWQSALAGLDPVNQGVMRVMNLCLVFQFLACGSLSLLHADALAATPLGRAVCAGLASFWLLRLGLQFTHFRALALRSLVLDVFFAATCAAYALPLLLAA
jgi:hypothetical protein